MRTITDREVDAVLDSAAVRAALDEAFSDLSRGEATIRERVRTDCGDLRLSAMGGLWRARGVAGQKVYTTAGGRFSFVVVLFDTRNNRPLAVVDGGALTRWRTSAITALVACKAARPGARRLALIGAGEQGRAQAEALCEALPLTHVDVVDPNVPAAWCEHLAAARGVDVRSAEARDAVSRADIVVTATRSTTPVFDGAWLQPGCFVSAVGTSAPKGRELDDVALSRAARVIVEWKPQSQREAGELVLWDRGRDLGKVVDLPQLYRGQQPWRAGGEEIVVFKTVGVGLSDVAAAELVVRRLATKTGGAGTDLDEGRS
jgi:ornithine cyclodeaminase